jgi:membrane-bound lytic murein transglycosylase D
MHPTRILILLALIVTAGTAAASDAIPRPAGIEPQVRFWTRIYSEVDQKGGLIHDSVHLDVVYEAIRIPEGLSRRSRERRIEKIKDGYSAILRRLARGKRTGLKPEEARVLAMWPEGVSNATLRSAASHLRFQLGQADRFRAGLKRSGRWREHILTMLRKHRVPLELAALPHVESSFNPAAYSSVGAAGLWQFTRSTGRIFMRVDSVVDERMDPFIASESAARLLRSNYDSLGSWPLAITAYNHGVGGMKRAVRKLGTSDIDVVVKKYKSRSFGFASRNFYAEFLAALDVDRNAERFFGPTDPESPVRYDIVKLDHFYTASAVETAVGTDATTLREHNRSLRPSVWNGAKYLPRGFLLRVPAEVAAKPVAVAIASIPDSQRFSKQHRDRFHKVRRGETLSKIARRYRVRERDLVALNNLRSRNRIRAGQVLTLPDKPGTRAPVVFARADAPADGIYRVRRGDTISRIAGRFGLTESKLVALNGLRNRHQISIGQRLVVAQGRPAPRPTKAVAAVKPAAPQPTVQPSEPVIAKSIPSKPSVQETIPTPAPRVSEPEPRVALRDPVRADPVSPPGTGRVPADQTPSIPAVPNQGIGSNVAEATDFEVSPVDLSPVIPAADPSDYAVTESGRITVQAAETLGHYAEWLDIPTHRLRKLNGMKYGAPVVIGRQKKLDFSRVTPAIFENLRLDYHRSIQESFFEAFEVTGTDSHVLRKGDTLWQLAERQYRLPVWLLRHYNPTLDFGALQSGTKMVIPRISPRTS